jgi:hypothetical protein
VGALEQLSLIDKFKVLFDNIFQHPLFIILLLVPMVIFLLQKKHGKKVFLIVYVLVMLFILYIGGNIIFNLFDNLVDGLFMTLYFPNFITLFIVVVLCSVFALVSFFSKKMYKVNKIINITSFAIIQTIFCLILTLINVKNVNVYADNALYANSDLLTLMQLLIGTFALQVIAILIINGINKVTAILDKRAGISPEVMDDLEDVEKTKKKANNLSKIKNIKIDNDKVGFINVADKVNTSKPKLKPFKFDMDKIESISLKDDKTPTFNQIFNLNPDDLNKKKVVSRKPVGQANLSKDSDDLSGLSFPKTEAIEPSLIKIPTLKEKPRLKIKNKVEGKLELKPVLPEKPEVVSKVVVSEEVNQSIEKPNVVLKPILPEKPEVVSKVVVPEEVNQSIEKPNVVLKPVLPEKPEVVSKVVVPEEVNKLIEKPTLTLEPTLENKFISKQNVHLDQGKLIKPDLMQKKDLDVSPVKPQSDLNVFELKPDIKPNIVKAPVAYSLVRPKAELVDNLNILDMQSTLDTAVKFTLMKNVKLKVYEEPSLTIDNLQIPNFDRMAKVLKHCRLVKKLLLKA